jgi:hypothetical protein
MDKLPEKDKVRLSSILKTIYESFAGKFEEGEKKSQQLELRLSVFQPKLINYIRQKCSKEYEWIEKNVSSLSNGEIKIKDESKAEADKYFSEWEACASKNDFGTREFFQNLETQQKDLHQTNEKCMKLCIDNLDNKIDDDLKICFTNCFSSMFHDTEKVIESINKRLDDIERRL